MVEKYWNDVRIYFVEYLSKNKKMIGEKSIVVNKTFVFDSHLAKKDIIKHIYTEIDDVIEIIYFEEFADGMLLKKIV